MTMTSPSSQALILLRKTFALLLIAVLLAGCSYHGKIEPTMSGTPPAMARQPYAIAIDSSTLSSSQVTADPQWFSLTVDSGNALAESIRQQLSRSFSSVVIVNNRDIQPPADYMIALTPETASRCTMNSCGISTRIAVRLVDATAKGTVLLAEDFLDVYTLQMPGSSILVNLFTGLSLFVLAPVLQPISAHFAGKELTQRVSDSNDRLSFTIAKRIAGADIFGEKVP